MLPANPGADMRVLIVDDSRSSLAMIGTIIKAATNAEIDSCLSPREALERSQATQYDLVLVDHIMPEMDGVQFTSALRARQAYRLVPIILVPPDMDRNTTTEATKAAPTTTVHTP